MSSHPSHLNYAAYAEDFSEDTNSTIPGTRQTANIAAKRSRPDIHYKSTIAGTGRDEASNSSDSSQTVATLASRGSSSQGAQTEYLPISSGLQQPPSRPNSMAADMVAESSRRSPEKPSIRRTISRTQKSTNLRQEPESREDAARMRLAGPALGALSSSRDPAQTRRRTNGPPSPQTTRAYPPPSMDDRQFPPPPPAQPRTVPAQGRRSRPTSFYAGSVPPQGQTAYIRDQQPESLYINTASYHSQFPQPHAAYLPTPLQTSPQRQAAYPFPQTTFALPYQPPAQWIPGLPSASSRRSSIYSDYQPIIEYSPSETMYQSFNAYPEPRPLLRRMSTRSDRPQQPTFSDRSDYIDENDEDYYRREMPPPSRPTSSQHRPTIRQAATTSSTVPTLRQRHSGRDVGVQSIEQSFRKLSIEEQRPKSRPTPTSRHSMASSRYSDRISPTEDRVPLSRTISKRAGRPSSYYEYDELERERQVEAYQDAKTGGIRPGGPTVDTIHQAERRRKKNSGGSGSGSRASSSREGSDVKKSKAITRNSLDKPRGGSGTELKTRRSEKNDYTISIGGGQGVQVGLNGAGVVGKTITLIQGQGPNAQTEIRIGGNSSVSSRDDRTTRTSSRDGRTRAASERRYSYIGNGKSVREFGEREQSRRRSKSRVAVDAEVGNENQKHDVQAAEEAVTAQLRNTRRESRSRRRSRSSVSRREVVPVEGQPF